MQTRGLEAFSRKVTTTASHLMNPNAELPSTNQNYHMAMTAVTKQLQRPTIQRGVFSMARTTPTDMVRSKLSTREIQQRALSSVPDEMLADIPVVDNSYSLFQGFQATIPEMREEGRKHHRRKSSRGRKLLEDGSASGGAGESESGKGQVAKLKREKSGMMDELEMLEIRKNMASCEIRDIDSKIANLTGLRRTVLEKLAGLEQEEALLEHDSRPTLSTSHYWY
jgi:division protein 1